MDRAHAAAAKEERLRDGKLALREYERNQSNVLANMQRLRALRLLRDNQSPLVIEPKQSSSRKKRTKE
jgi:hypothetical protein